MPLPVLKSKQVNYFLNSSQVGVILSEVEGACYASTEYLLAGIPVVSTTSKGGRDFFFDSKYSKIVKPHPEKIRDAIKEMIAHDFDPKEIRNETLRKINIHRNKFKSLLEKIHKDLNVEWDPIKWDNLFFNKMIKRNPFPEHFLEKVTKNDL